MSPTSTFDAVDCAVRRSRNVIALHFHADSDCPVCVTAIKGKRAKVLKCGHALHLRCALALARSNCVAKHMCPLCRKRVFEPPPCT